ncbi:GH32 C-terminal domain-containing protein [Sporosarcina sp. E16_3]|uniref:glycoside hydrolase family 32 protein n=1 Tax=Sporosarcina sp. E16_3 TaxID=2789293 RepID=UPI001A90F244|nr:glycoside hydrolase family 32 protein [Sporosarcina sp. E16_3]MBO0600786.1 GH32 C-terminal domain-containing protein [Sporosarcina sp. E16_3]
MKRLILSMMGMFIFLVGCSEVEQDVKGDNDLKVVGLRQKQAANADYYTEMYRPQYHFSTPSGNLADPNGLIYFEGEYHLFHQKNGNWAHAISTDMLNWEHFPVALEHDLLGQALSGSTVVDWNDSSGLFDGKAGLVAFYTSTEGGEAQGMAYSKDKGRTWERYKGNPIIGNPGIKDFRDPKVFWHEDTNKWIMVVSTNQSVTFYNSSNLIDWTFQSQFGDDEGSHVAVWECPELFQLSVDGQKGNKKWVLHVSVGDNDVTNGSTAQYFIGEFDGMTFVNDNPPETVLTTDFGQDFYAAQSFSDIPDEDGRRIWLGWMANWRYPYQSPTDPWMGSMTIPRELSLRTIEDGSIRIFQGPIKEIESLRAGAHHVEAFQLEGDHPIDTFMSTTFEFEMIVEWDDVEEFGIRLRQSEEEETVFGVDTATNKIFLDRSNAGLKQLTDRNGNMFQFGNRHETEYPMGRKQIKIRGLVDESSIELFVNEGEFTFTKLIYTKPTNSAIELYTKGGSVDVVLLDFFELNSTWRERPQADEMTGIVVSEEYITLKVGEMTTVKAQVKPNGYVYDESYTWEVELPNIVGITEQDDSTISVKALESGVTNITISDASGKVTKVMKVRVHS